MISYVVFAIALGFIMRSMSKDMGVETIWSRIGLIALSMFLATLVTVGITIIPQMIMRAEPRWGVTELNQKDVYVSIVSARNNSELSGSFFLGCGSINTEEYYVYFKQYKDGGVKRGMTVTYLCTIYEKNDVEPKIEWTEVDKKCHWLGRFGFNWADIQKDCRKGDYRLIVPEGTIIEKFEIK